MKYVALVAFTRHAIGPIERGVGTAVLKFLLEQLLFQHVNRHVRYRRTDTPAAHHDTGHTNNIAGTTDASWRLPSSYPRSAAVPGSTHPTQSL